MSVTTRQAFRKTFGSSAPVIAPLYSARCETWSLHEDGVFTCGISPECALRLEMPGIESLHCAFQLQNGTLTIRRERGRVWINDIPVASEAFLNHGDVLTLGPVSFSIDAHERVARIHSTLISNPQTPNAAPQFSSGNASDDISRSTTTRFASSIEQHRVDMPIVAVPVATASPVHEELLKTLETRERQLQDRISVIEERERLIIERQQAHDERARFLAEQKTVVEQQQQSFSTTEATLKRQKEELDQKLRSLSDREQKLARQMEDSAQAYSQLEMTRSRLSDELEKIAQREAAVTERSNELLRIARENDERHTRLVDEQEASAQQRQDLESRTQQIADESSRLAAREVELQRLAEQLQAHQTELQQASAQSLDEVTALRQELATRDHLYSVQRSQFAELQEKLRADQEQADALRRNLEESRQESASRISVATELADKLGTAESLIHELTQQVESQSLRIESLQAQRISDANASTSPDTRTIEQLAAIAAEREAALRAKQEAFVIQQQVREAKDRLASDEGRLQKWQAEVDSRYHEIADRVVFLKAALRNAAAHSVRITESEVAAMAIAAERESLETERIAIAADRVAIQQVRDEFSARETALNAAESRLAELQESARATQHAAETEREALLTSHKDLMFERNAQQQRNQDLQSREIGLHERELLVSRQTEDLRSRFEAMNQQTAELRRYEAELNTRASEIHHRILNWKSERDSSPVSGAQHFAATGEPGSEHSASQLMAELDDVKSQNDALASEREALMTAIREMQKALQDAREDVEEASRIKAASAKQEQTIAQLYQQIEERSNLLQLSESRFNQLLQELEEARRLMKEAAQVDADLRGQSEASGVVHDQSVEELESQLLSQIESLRGELTHSAEEKSSRQSEYTSLISERDSRIRDLEQMIHQLRDELTETKNSTPVPVAELQPIDATELDALRHRLEKAEYVLQDRDDLIRELRSRLIQQSRPEPVAASEEGPSVNRESLQTEARELDRRAQLLDHREEELRERSRRLDQTEEEVESQRRQLLDARQQLEIARAEIQVAMKQHSTLPAFAPASSPEAFSPSPASAKEFGPSTDHGHEVDDRGATSFSFSSPSVESDEPNGGGDLRSELAGLFGLKKPAAETPAPRQSSGALVSIADFVDLSEPSGQSQAVALKFGEDASSLVSSVGHSSNVEQEPEREENSDDFVRDYMEQLLARSRKSAGNALPNELKSNESKAKSVSAPQPVAAPVKKSEPAAPAKKEGPKVKSFIEQYMSGGFGDLTGEGTFPQVASSPDEDPRRVEEEGPAEPRQPRQKVDLQKLREDMNSFRTLSTQSVENALVDHAIRKERHSINGRITFVIVLVVMTIFLAIANVKNIINQPLLIWVTLVAAIGAAAELGRKYVSLKARCRVGLQGEGDGETIPTTSEDAEARRILAQEKLAQVPAAKSIPVATLDLDEELPHREREERFLMQPDDEQERSRYFEL